MEEWSRQQLDDVLGFVMERVDEAHVVGTLPLADLAVNQLGMAHGGAMMAVADSLMANVAGTAPGGRQGVLTVDMGVAFLAPGRGARLRFEAERLSNGRHLVQVKTRILDEGGTLVAEMRGLYRRLDPRQKGETV